MLASAFSPQMIYDARRRIGAAAVGLAVLLSGKLRLPGKKVVLVITGRNIASARFISAIASKGT